EGTLGGGTARHRFDEQAFAVVEFGVADLPVVSGTGSGSTPHGPVEQNGKTFGHGPADRDTWMITVLGHSRLSGMLCERSVLHRHLLLSSATLLGEFAREALGSGLEHVQACGEPVISPVVGVGDLGVVPASGGEGGVQPHTRD